MPATDYHGPSAPLAALGRSILSIRRDHVHAVDAGSGDFSGIGNELEAFQRQAADLFHDLDGDSAGGEDEIVSLTWVRRLLDTFLICLEEFRAVLFNGRDNVGVGGAARPPLDRLVSDFFERAVKALDICNAVRDGIGQVRQWQRHAEIVVLALDPKQKAFGSGQLRRARKALADLAVIMMLDKKDSGGGGSVATHRNRSFGRSGNKQDPKGGERGGSHFRSLSWSVSRSWSATKQLQAMGNNLAAPRGNDVAATNGLAVTVFTMNSVILFVMWALVAAIPCQDRGLQAHFSIPRSFPWAPPVLSLHERILEESKKKERKHSSGLLKEIHQVEKCARRLIELLDGGDVCTEEVREEVGDLAEALESMKSGLDPIELQLREVFHRIIRSRTDCIECGLLLHSN